MNPLLTDMYQIKMAFAEFQANRHLIPCVFEMYFRKAPFKGSYALAAGHDEVYNFLERFKFTSEHIEFLRKSIPQVTEEFLEWLSSLDCSSLKIYGSS